MQRFLKIKIENHYFWTCSKYIGHKLLVLKFSVGVIQLIHLPIHTHKLLLEILFTTERNRQYKPNQRALLPRAVAVRDQ